MIHFMKAQLNFIILRKIPETSVHFSCTYSSECSLNDKKFYFFQNKINDYVYIYGRTIIYSLIKFTFTF